MKDLKYLAAFTIPISAVISCYFMGYWSFFTPVYAFILIPILEVLLPKDASNLQPNEIEDKRNKQLFDWLLYLNVPIVFGLLFYILWDLNNTSYQNFEIFGLMFSLGIVLGVNGINVGHELGHRKSVPERSLGKLLLLPSLYMHFYIEHNYGHHLHAATKEDPATALYNQTVYSFWLSSIYRQYINAWKIQMNLLRTTHKAFFSLHNDMLWCLLIQALYLISVFVLFGLSGLLFAIGAAIIGFLLLETVNYIEHYGLTRQKLSSGRYERVSEIHSWNSNHIVGRIVLYELTRHSDHHYKSSKKYQLLNYHPSSPQMPYGYPTSMVLAMLPPLWFHIMNPRIPVEMRPSN